MSFIFLFIDAAAFDHRGQFDVFSFAIFLLVRRTANIPVDLECECFFVVVAIAFLALPLLREKAIRNAKQMVFVNQGVNETPEKPILQLKNSILLMATRLGNGMA